MAIRSNALPGDSPPASTGASVVGVVGALRSLDRRTAERMTMLTKPSTRRPALMPHIWRGPTDSVNGPATSVPTSVNVCTMLPSTAKT